MEQRIPLSQGATVQQFIVDRVIGFGASCLVYEAHYLDSSNHRKEVILKECYPCNAGTSRIGNKIIWSSAEEQEKAFLRFDNAYEIAAKIQNVAGAKSVSVYSLDKLTENGTQYVATIPNGTSYDKNGSTNIAGIIRTALALTNAVGLYHKAGYLHLDIKPSNFIATEDQTGKGKNIVLFDVDTVVSQDDIQGGNLHSVSYSKECAAPEQKMQQMKKLCPATDLFAVGAVLFERIMNRPVDSSDSTLFATWDYDSRFDAKKINPKAKRLLTEIFHKTLAANVKRRYQSADELAEALGELRDVIDSPSPYIYSYPVETNCTFVGRSSEQAEIHKGLTINNRVFVKGAGGIGKTELVRKYVSIYQDKYDAVVFMMYNGSVSECLNDIKPIGVDSKDRDNKALLKEICDNDKILLILDNYDVAPNESADLNELFELNCKVIVTTRTDFSERNPNSYFVEVSGLSAEVLKRIFENGISRELSDSEFDALKPILHIGQECTYFWSMAARLANEGAYTISEIVEKVSLGLDDLDESEDIFDTKDGKNINTTVAKAMLVLFKLDELTDKEFDVLKAMYFLDCLNLDKRQVKEILSFSEKKLMNAFNALVKKGYIEKINVASREVYRISDVLRNVLEYKVEPDISNTKIVTLFIEEKLFVNKEMLTGLNKCTNKRKDFIINSDSYSKYCAENADVDVNSLTIACRGSDFENICTTPDLSRTGKSLLKKANVEEDVLKFIDEALYKDADIVEKEATAYLFRRNFATMLQILGLSQSEIEYIMGHEIESEFEKRNYYSNYDKLYPIKLKMDNRPLLSTQYTSDIVKDVVPGTELSFENPYKQTIRISEGFGPGVAMFDMCSAAPGEEIQMTIKSSKTNPVVKYKAYGTMTRRNNADRTSSVLGVVHHVYSSKKGRSKTH